MSEMSKVPFNCKSCGADFNLFHDGETDQSITVHCACGTENHWSFEPPLGAGFRGWGFCVAEAAPAELPIWRGIST